MSDQAKKFTKRIKKIYVDSNKEEKQRIHKIMQELLSDKYYKENMLYYFKHFLGS